MESVPRVHPDLKRHVVDGLAAFLNNDMELAAREFRQAAIACEDVGIPTPKHLVPPPGSLADGYLELAERATNEGAKRHWRELAEAEMEAAR